jgi:hypothetical protein
MSRRFSLYDVVNPLKGGDVSERNWKSNQYWVVGPIAVAFLVTFTMGCAKTDSTKGVADTAVATADTVATDLGLNEIPGTDTANTRAYLATLNPHWATEPITLSFECHKDDCAGNRTVHIATYTHRFTSEIDAAKILDRSASNNLPGHIVLKMVNRDTFPFNALGMEAKDSAYLWVGKTNKARAYAVFKIDQHGNATGVARAFRALLCTGSPDSTHAVTHVVALPRCIKPDTTGVELYHDPEPPHISALPLTLHDQGTWWDCKQGCCQVQTFGSYQ